MGSGNSRGPLEEWEIVQGIGTGTFGAVMAVRKRRESPVDESKLYAMKCISKREVLQRKALEGTMAEMRLMAEISPNPFVLRLHYAFQDPGTLYLITDLCEGGSLDQLVRREGRLKEKAALFLFAELILGLEHLHKFGIIHMDVKLANCLLDILGHLKLADFNGAAKFTNSKALFDSKSYFGTSGYLSPEVLIMDTGFVVCAPDWWSAGVCFWTMLHGKKGSPWLERRRKFRSWEQELQVIVSKRKPNISPHVSLNAVDIISKLLRLDWKTRLGCCGRGSEELKEHKVFAGLNWEEMALGDIDPPIRPQALAFSEENSERTADKWVRESLHQHLLNEPLSPNQQVNFCDWNFSIEANARPEFAILNTFASMDAKKAKGWVARAENAIVRGLIADIKKLQALWAHENKELAVSQNMIEMLRGENAQLKQIIREHDQQIEETSRVEKEKSKSKVSERPTRHENQEKLEGEADAHIQMKVKAVDDTKGSAGSSNEENKDSAAPSAQHRPDSDEDAEIPSQPLEV
mmetsp:Transcript_29661/g.57838  ORF Transcript_29661/g.57838 Transcript_29661/m.57838 type:complete len:521 (+) Transcript_29661:48-1610(+)